MRVAGGVLRRGKGGFETRPYEATGLRRYGRSVVGLVLEVGEALFEAALVGGEG